ncbi:protein MIX23-like isoform X3 [Artemia franciscana]|uniref:protein MIX23-like isoform X3 n=1 Tax=Artemia franciscana TaxID=6661 RepID=UPI0032DA2713
MDNIKKLRTVDDKIIYALNTKIPTESFKAQVDATGSCKALYEELKASHKERLDSIKHCISVSAENVHRLRDKKSTDFPENTNAVKSLKKEQSKLRLLKTEANVEEILQEKTLKTYYERCRSFYKPPDSHF